MIINEAYIILKIKKLNTYNLRKKENYIISNVKFSSVFYLTIDKKIMILTIFEISSFRKSYHLIYNNCPKSIYKLHFSRFA